MNDAETTEALNSLASRIHRNAVSHGFWDAESDHRIKLMLIVEEVIEAFSSLRKHGDNEMSDHLPNMSMVDEELADVIIRALDLGYKRNPDFGSVVLEKVVYNESRPFLHGKRF